MLVEMIPTESLESVKASGRDLVERIGYDEMRRVVAGILCGENVRAATEPLTRRRLAALNATVLITLHRASNSMSPGETIRAAHAEYEGLRSSDPRRTVLLWIMGLTTKQVQNVLRSDRAAWADYLAATESALEDSARASSGNYGDVDLRIAMQDGAASWGWLWSHALMAAVGAQTLATRGAEKSLYGKFFEKVILGCVLDVLGFTFDPNRSGRPMTFWLSERGERRESDASAIIADGVGVRFDIGFIGPGNSEISLDKVSRFARVAEIGGRRVDMATIVIVDRIGQGSSITELAREIDGVILQMSSSLWAKALDEVLASLSNQYVRTFGANSGAADVRRVVEERLDARDFRELLQNA